MTEWARSRKELCRPEGEGDREVRTGRGDKGHSFLRSGPGDSRSHAKERGGRGAGAWLAGRKKKREVERESE